MTNKTITVSVHLGQGEQGKRRKATLTRLAEKFRWDSKPSIGRWLCALADKAGTKPEPHNLDVQFVDGISKLWGSDLAALEDAILIQRQKGMIARLLANGFGVITGESEGWVWQSYIVVIDPTSDHAVFADLDECRVLLDTVREMNDPAAAFERWLPKVKVVGDGNL